MNNIQTIVDQAICTGCGACAGICKLNAISMKENTGGFLYAYVNLDTCVNCKQCLTVCPSNQETQTIEDVSASIHGNCIQGYIGHATAKKVRWEGQSGGIVTALLLYLLESGKIDGAITNQYDAEKNRPKAIYVDTADEIKKSAGSYYCQSSVVQSVSEHRGKRLAAVVLGCQAEALRLYQEQYSESFCKVLYTLGLVCVGQNSGCIMDDLLMKTDCGSEELPQKFRFKYSHPAYGGWPGNTLISTDKYRYRVDKSVRLSLKPKYEAFRCLLCYDQMCVDADIVCGDPWGIPGNHLAGETVVITRTENGEQLLRDAVEQGYISIRKIDVQDIMKGETVDDRHFHKVAAGYQACKKNGWQFPYAVSENAACEFSTLLHKSHAKQLDRLKYTRERYLSKEQVDLIQVEVNYEKIQKKEAQKLRRKQLLSAPKKHLKYILKFIKR